MAHLHGGGQAQEVGAEEFEAVGDTVDTGVVRSQVQAWPAAVHARRTNFDQFRQG